jgi:cullin 4
MHILSLIKQYLSKLQKTGRAMVMNTEQDKTLVSDLMAFKARLDLITVQSFEANERFQNASKDAFDFFVNTKPNKIAELIGGI